MKKAVITIVGICLLLTTVIFSVNYTSAENTQKEVSLEPPTSIEKKFRIGYVETDPFVNFAGTFYFLLKGLQELGWITDLEGIPFKPGQGDSKVMWDWLVENNDKVSKYIEFVPDAHYSLLVSEEGIEQKMIERIKVSKDIDLLLAMGTLAGKTLSDANLDVPTMVFSATNAVNSGIIKSVDDSGFDNMWAHMDPNRYERQIEVFHDIFNFKTLGIVYENSDVGQSIAGVSSVEKVAKDKGFEIQRYYVDEPKNEQDYDRYNKEIKEAYTRLAENVDVMYLTAGAWDPSTLSDLIKPFYDKKVPVLSMVGASDVEHGALMSVARADFTGIGSFGAENIVKIINGVKPRDLEQVYVDTPSIVLNLEVADKIEYQTPFEILLVADEIYQKIKTSQ